MGKGKPPHLHGALDLLILRCLNLDSMHGWGVSKYIQQLSDGVLEVNQGSLYPALYRLQDQGWIRAEWGTAPSGRRAKIYHLTRSGAKQLALEESEWVAFHRAVNRIVSPT